MKHVNKTTFIGNVGSAPKLPKPSFCTFSVATDRWIPREDEQFEKLTYWHDLQATGSLAERAMKDIKAGALIYVECSHQPYEIAVDGSKQKKSVFRVTDFSVIESPDSKSQPASSEPQPTESVPTKAPPTPPSAPATPRPTTTQRPPERPPTQPLRAQTSPSPAPAAAPTPTPLPVPQRTSNPSQGRAEPVDEWDVPFFTPNQR